MHVLDERQRRWIAAAEASRLGYGGVLLVAQITGLAPKTIRRGQRELAQGMADLPSPRIRQPGAGRPPTETKKPQVEAILMDLVRDEVAGDPSTGVLWVRRSLAKLQRALAHRGLRVGILVVRRLLRRHNIHARSSVKHLTPREHPSRDRQFRYITTMRRQFEAACDPIISVDTKKKELIGRFKNAGRIYGVLPPEVNTHDFPGDAEGKAVPYGVFDTRANDGVVYVGVSGNTPDFAVAAIRRWWQQVGRRRYPGCHRLLILADGGGSNGYRARRWKQQLQVRVADPYRLEITVCHYPTGASKWNPIEHRLFSQISQTWAGTPLTSMAVVLDAIRHTTTRTGLRVRAQVLPGVYARGCKVTDAEMTALSIKNHETCPKWNYTVKPRPKKGK
jgi:Rhodopirellula transposase DDE domain